jgi:hypothetical protein
VNFSEIWKKIDLDLDIQGYSWVKVIQQ